MSISEKVRQGMSAGSWIRRMFEEGAALKQRYGEENVFDLSLGNPVMEPPAGFFRELEKLAAKRTPGSHRYMPNAGYPETRAAVAEQLSRETGLDLGMQDIIMTCGAAGALNVALKTLLNQGEEVILFAPYFVEYLSYIDNHNGVANILPTDGQFLPRMDALESGINARTRAVIINSPNNPTGVVYDEGLLRQMGEIIRQKEAEYGTEIYLLSDEPYRKIIYDGIRYPSPLNHHPRSIIVTSHSKDLALPGERIGYLAVNPACSQHEEVVNGCIFCNRTLGFVNAPALMQNIVRHLQSVTVSVNEYRQKRDFLYSQLTGLGYEVVRPQGAFYMFPRTPIADDVAFVKELQKQQVLTVPGSGFGKAGHFRISYCVDDRTLQGAVNGLRQAMQKYRPH